MKRIYKNLLIAITTLSLIIISVIPAFAYSSNDIDDYVIDYVDILTDSEEELLKDKIDDIRKKYDYDIVLHTTNSFNGKSKVSYSDDMYDSLGFSNDGMIFVINIKTRDYYTSTSGSGIDIFDYYNLIKLHDEVKPYLSKGDYYEAFDKYLDLCVEYINEPHNEVPYSSRNESIRDLRRILDSKTIVELVLASFLIALIVTFILKGKMNNVHMGKSANNYEVNNSFSLSTRRDQFIFKNLDKQKIERYSGSSHYSGGSSHHSSGSGHYGGGSSHNNSSSGRPHGGGGGKF